MTAHRTPTLVIPMPSRESARLKAIRLLIEGRLRVRLVHRHRVHVEVRGDSGRVHNVMFTNGEWHCSCEARRPGCAHQLATWLVIASENP